jgi:hypothetical protein
MRLDGLDEIRDCTILAPVTIKHLWLHETMFSGSSGLDQLRIYGIFTWQRRHGRRMIADEAAIWEHAKRPRAHSMQPYWADIEVLYRQLRVGLESSKAAPAAADFYVGELNARRRAGAPIFDRVLLFVYRWVGGYCVRPVPPFLSLIVLVTCTALLFRYQGETLVRLPDMQDEGYQLHRFWDSFALVARSSVSLFSAPTGGLTSAGTLVLIVERFAAVGLLAMVVFALRSRVHR